MDPLNNESKPEYILCAAIWFNDNKSHQHQPKNIGPGFVICGRRHHNCYLTAALLYKSVDELSEQYNEVKKTAVQGFLTSKDRFVERAEAAHIAFEQKQIDTQPKILFSEHLY